MSKKTRYASRSSRWVLVALSYAILTWAPNNSAFAGQAAWAPSHQISGGDFAYVVQPGDSLRSIGSRYGVSVASLAADNGIKNVGRLHHGRILRINNRHIPPGDPTNGILINVPQRMLFLFRNGSLVSSYPAAVGRPTWQTRLGSFKVTDLERDPVWVVPSSIQFEMRSSGQTVRRVVPPGPDNPLGRYAIHLSMPGYLIHGTNAPLSIYSFRTHGCIRLNPDDIEALYNQVQVGEVGKIVYQPSLMAIIPDGRIFIEVNKDIYHLGLDSWATLRALAEVSDTATSIDWKIVNDVIARAAGIAREVDLAHSGERTMPSPPDLQHESSIAHDPDMLAKIAKLQSISNESVGPCSR